jgi:hypothetical protein
MKKLVKITSHPAQFPKDPKGKWVFIKKNRTCLPAEALA